MNPDRCLMKKVFWVLCAALMATGCVEHRAALETGEVEGMEPMGALAGTKVVYPWKGAIVHTDPLAAEMPVTVVFWTEDGRIARADARPQSPLVWWQRFPFDIGTDLLWPGQLITERVLTVSPQPMSTWNAETLTAQARLFGYAGDELEAVEETP